MIRIIDGVAYEGKASDSVRLKAFDLGNGHLEVMASKVIVWEELDWQPFQLENYLDCVRAQKEDEQAHRLKMAEKAAKRAKRRVRQLCKVAAVDTMLTLTYRENMGDIATAKKHVKEAIRRITRYIPGFRCIVAFERQERGAWHMHIASQRIPTKIVYKGAKLPSFGVLRSIWRGITKDLGGTVNVSQRKRVSQRSPAKLAAYISKYVTKDYVEGEKWSNRWAKYGDFDTPQPVDLGLYPNMAAAVVAAFGLSPDDTVTATCSVSRWNDCFFIAFEKKAPS